MLKGGCFCGRVRYEAAGVPFDATICHCTDCRRVAAAPMVGWFSVGSGQLRFVAGEPRRFPSSAKAVRSFCVDCGTPLTYQAVNTPEAIDVLTVTLDDPETVPPADHVWTAEKLSWVRLSDGLPTYPGSRPPHPGDPSSHEA